MKRKKSLTTPEIHMLGCILTGTIRIGGKIYKHLGFHKKRDMNGITTVVIELSGGKKRKRRVKESTINALSKQRLIYLVPPQSQERLLYIGKWEVNMEELELHPQFNEIRSQAALGT